MPLFARQVPSRLQRRSLKPSFLAGLATLLITQSAFSIDFVAELKAAKIWNAAQGKASFCQQNDGSGKEPTGYRVKNWVPIASVSKVFTSYMAVKKYGAFYRFKTDITVYPVEEGVFDVQIKGSNDPLFNYDKVYLLISELNKKGVKKIRNLFFDRNFFVYLSSHEMRTEAYTVKKVWDPAQQLNYVTQKVPTAHTLDNLKISLNTENWNKYGKNRYNDVRAEARNLNIEIVENPELVVENVVAGAMPALIKTTNPLFVLTIQSQPLFRYLKDLNKYSHNFLADQIYLAAGGNSEMKKFLVNHVGLQDVEFAFYTGSGMPDYSAEPRKDNQATCNAVIKMMDHFAGYLNDLSLTAEEQELLGRNKIRLSDILLVAGVDRDATLDADYANMNGSVVAKTGTLNHAFNVAGYVNTQAGVKWFGIFLNSGWSRFRSRMVSKLIDEGGGPKAVPAGDYIRFYDFLPFDGKAVTINESPAPELPVAPVAPQSQVRQQPALPNTLR